MKKSILILILALGICVASNTSSFAQLSQPGDLKVGVGLAYGSEVENLGIKADGYYTINEQFRVGADLVYYFPDSQDFGSAETTINYFGINFNGNYVFINEADMLVYGIAGINILNISVDSEGFGNGGFGGGSFSSSTTETGLNLGGGAEFGMGFGALFAELKFAGIGGDADQIVFGGGARFSLN